MEGQGGKGGRGLRRYRWAPSWGTGRTAVLLVFASGCQDQQCSDWLASVPSEVLNVLNMFGCILQIIFNITQ